MTRRPERVARGRAARSATRRARRRQGSESSTADARVGIEPAMRRSRSTRDSPSLAAARALRVDAAARGPARRPREPLQRDRQPVRDPARVVFGWLYDVVALHDRRPRGVRHARVRPVPGSERPVRAAAPARAARSAPTVGDVWRAVGLPPPVVGREPGEPRRDRARDAAVVGRRRRPRRSRSRSAASGSRAPRASWSTGSPPTRATSARPRRPATRRSPAAAHRFATKGAHSLSVASVWQATVTMVGPGGAVAGPDRHRHRGAHRDRRLSRGGGAVEARRLSAARPMRRGVSPWWRLCTIVEDRRAEQRRLRDRRRARAPSPAFPSPLPLAMRNIGAIAVGP